MIRLSFRPSLVVCLSLLLFSFLWSAWAWSEEENWSVHLQATTVSQFHPRFSSPHGDGPYSLSHLSDLESTFSSTLFLGRRLWSGAELYLNPEIYGGDGFSGTLGVAGFPNGEVYRMTTSRLEPNLGRFYLKQVFALGSESEAVEPDENQLAGETFKHALTLILGKFSVSDFLDTNLYANDARTQFLNWSFMNLGSWDYVADPHGYLWGLFLEYLHPGWAVRMVLSREIQRKEERGLEERWAWNGEWAFPYRWKEQSGEWKFLVYCNRANLGSYQEALFQEGTQEVDLSSVRRLRSKYGFGLNFTHDFSPSWGAFSRWGWSNGQIETSAYTEVDYSISGGMVLRGQSWQGSEDLLGIGLVWNALTHEHAGYLAAGGEGFMLQDGYLQYAPEEILEIYYRWHLPGAFLKGLDFTPDIQWILHPGYNAARGPLFVFSGRLHFEL